MKDKRYRRIKSIMCKYRYLPKVNLPVSQVREHKLNKILGKKTKPLPVFPGVDPKSTEHQERMEVFRYFYALKKDDEYIKDKWWSVNYQRWDGKGEYKKKPKRERKDNQNPNTSTINWGSGGGGWSSIRVPSKKRKNKWKNFKKLFPNYKEK